MTCQQMQELLSLYIDEQLNEVEKQYFEKHLAECRQCKQELEDMQDMLKMFASVEALEPPADFKDNLMRRLKGEHKVAQVPYRTKLAKIKRSWIAWGATAAVIVIMVGSVGLSGFMDSINLGLKSESPAVKESAKDNGIVQDEQQFGIMSIPEKSTADTSTPETAYGAFSSERAADGEAKDYPRATVPNNGSRGLDKLSPDDLQEHEEALFATNQKIIFHTDAIDETQQKIVDLLKDSAINYIKVNSNVILGFVERNNADFLEEIKSLSQNNEENVEIVVYEVEFQKLKEKRDALLKAINDPNNNQGYERKRILQRELEVVKWQLENITEIDSDDADLFEIYITE